MTQQNRCHVSNLIANLVNHRGLAAAGFSWTKLVINFDMWQKVADIRLLNEAGQGKNNNSSSKTTKTKAETTTTTMMTTTMTTTSQFADTDHKRREQKQIKI
jgi:hypothetical protein